MMVSTTGDLELTDIGYLEAGEYRCRATNTIGGAERSTESEVITVKVGGASLDLTGHVVMLQVSGPPRLYGPVSHSVHVGDSAVLEMRLCSDPAPLANTWQWEGGVVLPAGASLDSRSVQGQGRIMCTSELFRFRAELESSPDLDKCFTARLTVQGAEAGDSRQYIVRYINTVRV